MVRKPKPDEVKVYTSYGYYGFDYNRREIVGMSVEQAIKGLLDPKSAYHIPSGKAKDYKGAFKVNGVVVPSTTPLKAGDRLILDCN